MATCRFGVRVSRDVSQSASQPAIQPAGAAEGGTRIYQIKKKERKKEEKVETWSACRLVPHRSREHVSWAAHPASQVVDLANRRLQCINNGQGELLADPSAGTCWPCTVRYRYTTIIQQPRPGADVAGITVCQPVTKVAWLLDGHARLAVAHKWLAHQYNVLLYYSHGRIEKKLPTLTIHHWINNNNTRLCLYNNNNNNISWMEKTPINDWKIKFRPAFFFAGHNRYGIATCSHCNRIFSCKRKWELIYLIDV